jgi:hypothetical protein
VAHPIVWLGPDSVAGLAHIAMCVNACRAPPPGLWTLSPYQAVQILSFPWCLGTNGWLGDLFSEVTLEVGSLGVWCTSCEKPSILVELLWLPWWPWWSCQETRGVSDNVILVHSRPTTPLCALSRRLLNHWNTSLSQLVSLAPNQLTIRGL